MDPSNDNSPLSMIKAILTMMKDVTTSLPQGTFRYAQKRSQAKSEEGEDGFSHEHSEQLLEAAKTKRYKASGVDGYVPAEQVHCDTPLGGIANCEDLLSPQTHYPSDELTDGKLLHRSPDSSRTFTMLDNLPLYRDYLLQNKAYATSADFLRSIGWPWPWQKYGEALVNKSTSENAIITVVGRVLERRLDCGPTGNFKGRYGPLKKAKYHLLLEKPCGTPFASDFDKIVAVLSKIQGAIASSSNCLDHLIVPDAPLKLLRFTRNIFTKRDCVLEGLCFMLGLVSTFIQGP
jgi:hypothetical protein